MPKVVCTLQTVDDFQQKCRETITRSPTLTAILGGKAGFRRPLTPESEQELGGSRLCSDLSDEP